MLAPLFLPRLLALWWGALQGAPIDGTWELARIFRPGPASASRAVPIDSTVYVRLTLTTMPGDWIGGGLFRRYLGKGGRAENQAGSGWPGRGRHLVRGAWLHPPTPHTRHP